MALKNVHQFEALFRVISYPCMVIAPEGEHFIIVEANPAYLQITGTERKDLLGKFTTVAFPGKPGLEGQGPELLPDSFGKVARSLKKDRIERLRYDIPVRATGEFLEKYWDIENIPLVGPSGDLEYIIHAAQDVTAQVLSEQKEKKDEQKFKALTERYELVATATHDLLYDWDLVTDQVLRFHSNQDNVLGHSLKKAKKRTFWAIHIHPDEVEGLRQQLQSALSDPGKAFINTEYRFMRADGSYAHIRDRGYIIRNDEGKAVRLVGASSDISELKNKEEALQIANKRFQLAMEATNEVIWDWNMVENQMERSGSFQKIYGYTTKGDSVKVEFWFSKIHKEDRERIERSLDKAINDPRCVKWKEEYRIIRADGEPVYVSDRGFIIRDQDGKAFRMVGSSLDVTESIKAVKRIKKQNELLKEIAWQQSHVVRAPLARMKGLLHLFGMNDFDKMSQEEIFSNLYASADELDDIVKKIVAKTEEIEE